jgi:NAD(P)-dependent dehydrogenase (short-subunit alcohol dehydrogenase family)
VYAGTRQPLAHSDPCLDPLALDVTDSAQIQAAAGRIESLDVLINNAGIALYDDLSDRAPLEASLAVNFYGTYAVTQAFLPALTRSGGAIVNILSAYAPRPAAVDPGLLHLQGGCGPAARNGPGAAERSRAVGSAGAGGGVVAVPCGGRAIAAVAAIFRVSAGPAGKQSRRAFSRLQVSSCLPPRGNDHLSFRFNL